MENPADLNSLKISTTDDILGVIGGLGLLLSPYLAYKLYKDVYKYKKYSTIKSDCQKLIENRECKEI